MNSLTWNERRALAEKDQHQTTTQPAEPVAEHSPLPWTAHDDDGTGTLPCVLASQVNTFGNFYVAQCNQFADAEFIVKMANLHEELIAALRECEDALDAFEQGCDCKGLGGCHQWDALQQARAVLAKVEAR